MENNTVVLQVLTTGNAGIEIVVTTGTTVEDALRTAGVSAENATISYMGADGRGGTLQPNSQINSDLVVVVTKTVTNGW
jgi:hypothetical protein